MCCCGCCAIGARKAAALKGEAGGEPDAPAWPPLDTQLMLNRALPAAMAAGRLGRAWCSGGGAAMGARCCGASELEQGVSAPHPCSSASLPQPASQDSTPARSPPSGTVGSGARGASKEAGGGRAASKEARGGRCMSHEARWGRGASKEAREGVAMVVARNTDVGGAEDMRGSAAAAEVAAGAPVSILRRCMRPTLSLSSAGARKEGKRVRGAGWVARSRESIDMGGPPRPAATLQGLSSPQKANTGCKGHLSPAGR